MNESKTLQQAFNESVYPVGGHGKRSVNVLLEAFEGINGDTESDIYGNGPLIEEFQTEMASYLGKPSAVFFPSGTMAQQIALRIWSDRSGKTKVAYHPLCHLEIHEQNGLRELHRLEPVLLADKSRLITLQDVEAMPDGISCLLLELPQREIGGQLPDYGELEAIAAYCRSKGIKLHLDGARLFEVLPYYGKSAAEVCAFFDSVYVSFYKGIGGIAGAILAGDTDFTDESKIWKRRHGGDLIGLYPYIIPAAHYFRQRLPKMEQYYEDAIRLAAMYNGCTGAATRPAVPVSNMFHVHLDVSKETAESAIRGIIRETGVGLTHNINAVSEQSCSYEISLGDRYRLVPEDKLREAFRLLDDELRKAKE
ncbi:threonine aldolase family protein [Paenibacillus sacheonensis]|uniref:Low specificity L-threonine aldolase n=1 Tax=Paenibacillus sacheonensis TaxID=742054 RepID=A0A7X4YKT3_9BACL|nr:beta-eliminating lyase-related protein [Paenibacillus sacheonensis]MBM7563194.1 threonine aldolase [Paenibacillus sacheonensis]NBC68243.1 low specificity L-threonine aldolase [Paenibacillus sacheonensis]